MKSILFVCLGNICRSPIAEGIATKIKTEYDLPIHIDSAGTSRWHIGEPPCDHAIKIALEHGIDISTLRARTVHPKDSQRFDYIVAMDNDNRNELIARGFKNVYLIGDYGNFNGADVPDPYFFKDFEGFYKVFSMLDIAVKDFMKKEGLWD